MTGWPEQPPSDPLSDLSRLKRQAAIQTGMEKLTPKQQELQKLIDDRIKQLMVEGKTEAAKRLTRKTAFYLSGGIEYPL
jgi:hypothetical protein